MYGNPNISWRTFRQNIYTKNQKQKINNESKLNNIEKELNSLLITSQNLFENDPKVFNKFIEELMIINLNLWETEERSDSGK